MKYKYTLDDGSHFLLAARDVSDLLDILHARTNQSGDDVQVWKVDEMTRQLNRALDDLEDGLNNDLTEIRKRREKREPAEFEPVDD